MAIVGDIDPELVSKNSSLAAAPYCDIAIYGRAPRIDSDPINEGFRFVAEGEEDHLVIRANVVQRRHRDQHIPERTHGGVEERVDR
jgi:hypothetical protein